MDDIQTNLEISATTVKTAFAVYPFFYKKCQDLM